MTRFARAKGSKASNEKAPEDGTPWEVMKEQLLRAKQESDEAKKREEAEKQRIENYENFLKEQKISKRKATWCDFPETKNDSNQIVASPAKKKKKNKDKSINDQTGFTENDHSNVEEVGKDNIKKKKNKNKDTPVNEQTDSTENINSNVEGVGNDNIKKKKNKNKQKGKNQNNEVSSNTDETITNGQVTSTENTLKKNKIQSSPAEPNQAHPNETKNLKNKKKNQKNTALKTESTESPTSNTDGNTNNMPVTKKNSNTPKQNKENKKNKKKLQANGEPNRRKAIDDHSFQLIINGKEVELIRFEGFPIMKKDAERLQELKASMIKKGIPKSEVARTIKLERRRAEKALARIKREVCYNCRKGGHNLSDCPELKSRIPGVEGANDGVCFKCGSTEHRQFECKVQRDKEFRFATCFICKDQGHIARQCPDNPKGLYPNGGSCKLCGDVTHLKKDCPTTKDQKEDTSVKLQTLNDGNLEDIGQKQNNTIPEETNRKPKKIKF